MGRSQPSLWRRDFSSDMSWTKEQAATLTCWINFALLTLISCRETAHAGAKQQRTVKPAALPCSKRPLDKLVGLIIQPLDFPCRKKKKSYMYATITINTVNYHNINKIKHIFLMIFYIYIHLNSNVLSIIIITWCKICCTYTFISNMSIRHQKFV